MQVSGGIASTTHVDSHGQIVDGSVLERFVEGIRAGYVPLLINHDHDRQIGVVLNARVVALPDGYHAALVAFGEFDGEADSAQFQVGAPNTAWEQHESFLDTVEQAVLAQEWPREIAAEEPVESPSVAELLDVHLASTVVAPDGSVVLVKRRIETVGDLTIEVYANDHWPPHFHVMSKQRNVNARFHLETLELLSVKHGTIGAKDLKKIHDFFRSPPDVQDRIRSEYNGIR